MKLSIIFSSIEQYICTWSFYSVWVNLRDRTIIKRIPFLLIFCICCIVTTPKASWVITYCVQLISRACPWIYHQLIWRLDVSILWLTIRNIAINWILIHRITIHVQLERKINICFILLSSYCPFYFKSF